MTVKNLTCYTEETVNILTFRTNQSANSYILSSIGGRLSALDSPAVPTPLITTHRKGAWPALIGWIFSDRKWAWPN